MIFDERGSTYLETLIVVPILFIGFVAMMMFARIGVAHLIVQRAAAAAVRAAVVILPDPDYYGNNGAKPKEDCVKEAARRVLMSSPHFKLDDGSIGINISGTRANFDPLQVEVRAKLDCTAFIGSSRFFGLMLCGPDRVATLSSASTLAYQLGPLEK